MHWMYTLLNLEEHGILKRGKAPNKFIPKAATALGSDVDQAQTMPFEQG